MATSRVAPSWRKERSMYPAFVASPTPEGSG
jgi:hypothetical protein